jgi:cobalt/nickel transport protein
MIGMTARRFIGLGLLAAVAVAMMLSPFASQSPDGLERVAEDQGFIDLDQKSPLVGAPLPDYGVPGMGDSRWSTPLAGVAGTLLTFGLAYGMGRLVARRKGDRSGR